MASACRAAAAALVKSFPPAVAAPFCTLVRDIMLDQHAGYLGIDWRKTFQESPRKARSSASARHGEARRGTGSLAAPRHLARALLKIFPPVDAAKLSMLSQKITINQQKISYPTDVLLYVYITYCAWYCMNTVFLRPMQ